MNFWALSEALKCLPQKFQLELDAVITFILKAVSWGIRNSGDIMADQKKPLSPTVKKVLDEYLAALHADETVSNDAASRLDMLLRTGRVPKFAEIDEALSPAPEGK